MIRQLVFLVPEWDELLKKQKGFKALKSFTIYDDDPQDFDVDLREMLGEASDDYFVTNIKLSLRTEKLLIYMERV